MKEPNLSWDKTAGGKEPSRIEKGKITLTDTGVFAVEGLCFHLSDVLFTHATKTNQAFALYIRFKSPCGDDFVSFTTDKNSVEAFTEAYRAWRTKA